MSDTIKRWECPECGQQARGWHRGSYIGPVCPGVPVERTYVAVDDFADRVIDAMIENDGGVDSIIERRVRAAIAAVTGEQA